MSQWLHLRRTRLSWTRTREGNPCQKGWSFRKRTWRTRRRQSQRLHRMRTRLRRTRMREGNPSGGQSLSERVVFPEADLADEEEADPAAPPNENEAAPDEDEGGQSLSERVAFQSRGHATEEKSLK
ncbi:unnamed protein product [Linum trigynum]|uniref:Uncharacterized protein n=1 Tax=Linum trigynum TaxID=586398 RepID=A0AAV2CIY6_9ROSI